MLPSPVDGWCKPFATRWFKTIFFGSYWHRQVQVPFLTVDGMNLCVSWLDRYEAKVFSSNGQLGLVVTELLSFTWNVKYSVGLGWNPRASLPHRLAGELVSVWSQWLLLCPQDPLSGYLKGEGLTWALSCRGVSRSLPGGCDKVIVHDRNQRGAGLEFSCLSPSAPFMPPRLLAQDWCHPYLRWVSVSFGNTPTDSSRNYAPPTCPGDPKANHTDN